MQSGQATPDEHDAWCLAEWLRRTDETGELPLYFNPELTEAQDCRHGGLDSRHPRSPQ